MEDAGNTGYRDNHLSKMLEEGFSFSGFERNPLYLSRGDRTYLDISGVSGVDADSDGRAAVFADFDNDGDPDIFVTNIQGQAQMLFRNNVGQENRFLRLALEGTASGRDAFGAVARVKTELGIQTKIKSGGSGYISQHDPRLLFGLGSQEGVKWLEVTWPSGARERINGPLAAGSYRIVEGSSAAVAVKETPAALPDPWSRVDLLAAKLKVGIGDPLPDLALTSRSGEPTSLHAALEPGTRHLLNLWATWCGPCRAEIPELQRLAPELEQAGIRLVGLSIDAGDSKKADSFLGRLGASYENFVVVGDAAREIYATDDMFVPLSFVIDERGVVLDMFKGWSADSLEKIKRLASR